MPDITAEPGGMAVDQVLDCTGQRCPMPIVKTAQAIKDLELGQVLMVLATDPGFEPDIKAWAGRTGNELLEFEKQGGMLHAVICRAK